MKSCNICKETKSLDSFYKDKYGKNGLMYRCIECSIAINKEQKVPEKLRRAHLMRNHNMSLETYNLMLEEQMGVCAICLHPESSKHQNGKIKSLAVDHCHETGKIRGLLCLSCNIALGKLKDNVFIINSAFNYLKNSYEDSPAIGYTRDEFEPRFKFSDDELKQISEMRKSDISAIHIAEFFNVHKTTIHRILNRNEENV